MYRRLFDLVLARLPPEAAHRVGLALLRAVGAWPPLRRALRRRLGPRDPRLAVRVLGREFPSPLGSAAGLDKDGEAFEALGCLGFGFVEVGTVTARAQPGRPRPRILRLVADRALINWMGFPNRGAAAADARLRRATGDTVVAVNVGRSRDADDVAADYRAAVGRLATHAAFLVLNVSSPNTEGLRDLQERSRLAALIAAVRDELAACGASPPLLVKVSPDVSDAELDAIADLALELRLDGIVATNTTTARPPLRSGVVEPRGGLSGPPLAERSLAILRRLHARTRGEVVLVAVGGIDSAAAALERILAGASLVQAYTGFVYGGPLWPARVNRELARLVAARGAGSVQELVGAGAPAPAVDRAGL